MTVCYVTLSLTPSGLNLCQKVKTVYKTLDTLIFIQNMDSSTELPGAALKVATGYMVLQPNNQFCTCT